MDVIELFTNTIHDEGLHALKTRLDKRENPEVPTDILVKMMEIILKNNIFEFHDGYFRQNIGAAMGSRPYANIFMETIDNLIMRSRSHQTY